MTYATLKTIREQDQSPEHKTSALGLSPEGGGEDGEGGGRWLTWDPAKIGWHSNSGGGEEQRGRDNRRRLGPFRMTSGGD